jgi:hypothetical protein
VIPNAKKSQLMLAYERFYKPVALHESFWNSDCMAQISLVEVFDYYDFMITVFRNIKAIFGSVRTG